MLDGDLDDSRAGPGDIDRDKAVHLSIQRNVLDEFFSIHAQGAAIVVQIDIREPRDQPVGNLGRKGSREIGVLPVFPPAADHVGLIELLSMSGMSEGSFCRSASSVTRISA